MAAPATIFEAHIAISAAEGSVHEYDTGSSPARALFASVRLSAARVAGRARSLAALRPAPWLKTSLVGEPPMSHILSNCRQVPCSVAKGYSAASRLHRPCKDSKLCSLNRLKHQNRHNLSCAWQHEPWCSEVTRTHGGNISTECANDCIKK